MITGIFLTIGYIITIIGAFIFGLDSNNKEFIYKDKFSLFSILVGFIICLISLYNM